MRKFATRLARLPTALDYVVASVHVPALEAPVDLRPRMATVRLSLPGRADLAGGSVSVETPGSVKEITKLNNTARF